MSDTVTISASEPSTQEALATLVGILGCDLICVLAGQLDGLVRRKAHGGLEVDFNMRDGKVESADMRPRVHWRRKSALDNGKGPRSNQRE